MNNLPDISLVILSYNGLHHMEKLIASIRKQTIQPELIIIDSESSDGTREWLTKNGIPFTGIRKSEFDHGGTRNLGLDLSTHEYVAYVTQDVIFDNADALENLVRPLVEDEKVGIGFGRQLPHADATILSEFARLHNYPPESLIKSMADAPRLGIKTPWTSNSFSIYKKKVLNEVGKFPAQLISTEDAYAGGKAILAGYKIAYVGNARVFHSHNYSIKEEFKRYFDIGYFYNSESWILTNFGKAEGEGLSFVFGEAKYVTKRGKPWLVFEIGVRTVLKYLGYQLGKHHKHVPTWMKKKVSMHSYYWTRKK